MKIAKCASQRNEGRNLSIENSGKNSKSNRGSGKKSIRQRAPVPRRVKGVMGTIQQGEWTSHSYRLREAPSGAELWSYPVAHRARQIV
eukprot:scaffold187628_cov30-Tisochrysis_lutea.AAC.2